MHLWLLMAYSAAFLLLTARRSIKDWHSLIYDCSSNAKSKEIPFHYWKKCQSYKDLFILYPKSAGSLISLGVATAFLLSRFSFLLFFISFSLVRLFTPSSNGLMILLQVKSPIVHVVLYFDYFVFIFSYKYLHQSSSKRKNQFFSNTTSTIL